MDHTLNTSARRPTAALARFAELLAGGPLGEVSAAPGTALSAAR